MTTYAERVREAVDDEEWQKFRRSLKGIDTQSKLNNLRDWYNDRPHTHKTETFASGGSLTYGRDTCAPCIQLDNYLKALARGGQLHSGVNLINTLAWDWCLKVRK
jgi:hypothetical protein